MSYSFFFRLKVIKVSFVFMFSSICFLTYSSNVGIVGAGYVGLSTAAILKNSGHEITCLEIDSRRLDCLKKQELYLYEKDLDELLFNSEKGEITFTGQLQDISDCELVFICTNTPPNETGECDISSVTRVLQDLLDLDKCPSVLVVKSTLSPGSMEKLGEILKNKEDISLAYNPEFMREGSAIYDISNSNPIIIGTEDQVVFEKLQAIYRPLFENSNKIKIIKTSPQSAELIKYGWNGFSAMRITYANELSRLCDYFGANIQEVLKGVSLSELLLPTQDIKPGCGYGGSCLPKDTLGFSKVFEKVGIDNSLIHQTIRSNYQHIFNFYNKIKSSLADIKEKPRVCLLGLAFKANTNDIRSAPSLIIIKQLLQDGFIVQGYDPLVNDQIRDVFPNVSLFDNPYDALRDVDCVIGLTDSDSIINISLEKMSELMRNRNLVDTKRMWDSSAAKLLGFHIYN